MPSTRSEARSSTRGLTEPIKTFGVRSKQGDSVMITKVKVKDDHIEFQLGGGATERPVMSNRHPRRQDL